MRRFKKIMKWLGLTLAILLLIGGVFIAHTWYLKPVNINLFFARAFMQVTIESPEMRNLIATPAEEGILMVALTDKMKEADLPSSAQQRIALEARVRRRGTAYS